MSQQSQPTGDRCDTPTMLVFLEHDQLADDAYSLI